MKKLAILPLIAVLSLSIFSGNKAEAAINNKPGDIIVTKSTAGSGIVGHSGIYIDTTHILHTSGRKNEPYPRIDTESEWHARYAQSKVVRPDSSTIGSKAAEKAKYYFKGKTIPYKITSNPTNITNIYCSELVWYSYYKAGKTFKTRNSSGNFYQPTDLVTPYNFIDSANVDYNNFSFIDNTW
ncbi:hypothetical protein [Peribacillus sp. R9-11]|uniref:hypothetical protein n=1 Tax=Peribacillus sp. R9-11 TaxID=3073271 RepID=UPI0028693361|nr:hypothetical protein [Peribacillus sp. R9-11]WMX58953.1 hypothetical protein RE409_30350 [Peribacillus sp. R9-11]